MTNRDELLKERFLINMGRINGLVHLVFSNEELRPTALFRSEGARAEILRSVVVFLHATFEGVLRSYLPRPNKRLSSNSATDLEKALTLSRIDTAPFKRLYPPLTQLTKRRNRIVHNADLSKHNDITPEPWGIVDNWQLIMWFLAVLAFYYQLRMSVDVAGVVERTMYKRLREAMLSHVEVGKKFLAFPKVPQKLRREALEEIAISMERIAASLELDVSDFIVNEDGVTASPRCR